MNVFISTYGFDYNDNFRANITTDNKDIIRDCIKKSHFPDDLEPDWHSLPWSHSQEARGGRCIISVE